jgi:hypothetical protein
MADDGFVVQRIEWVQLRRPDGEATVVLLASLPNGFFTATPVELPLVHADHSLIGLGASPEDALAMVQANLAGKSNAELFAAKRKA